MLKKLILYPKILKLGSLLFHRLLFPNSTIAELIPDILTVIITSINFIFPAQQLNETLCYVDESSTNTLLYDSAKLNFATVKLKPKPRKIFFKKNLNFTNKDYDRSNPVTQEKAMHEWVEFLESKTILFNNFLFASNKI